RGEENRAETEAQEAVAEKIKRRNPIFVIAAIVSVVAVVSLVFYTTVYVLPFQRTVARVDNESVKMDYVIRRVMMNTQGSAWSTIQAIVNERILAQEAPAIVGDVSVDDIEGLMRTTAQGDAESITDAEFASWLQLQLSVSQLSETQFRELFRISLLESRLSTYLGSTVSNIAPQVHLSWILVATYEEATAAKARIDGGEPFSVVAKEVSTDATKTNGGDVGWTPTKLLEPSTKSIVEGLAINVCSDPIPLGSSSDPNSTDAANYALVMISEKTDAKEVTPEQLDGLKQAAYQDWINQEQKIKDITFHGIHGNLDTQTFAWISYQVTRLQAVANAHAPTTTTSTTPTTTAGGQ
ncbi:MAG: peptidylprolyl isomerase, partial [Dehalococcoidales bacterium]|nr:peptidylprolyl isomerase [Dehalococcoidales bacterium]